MTVNCAVPHTLWNIPTQALDALKSDSQKGTFGKRGDKPKVDPAYLDQADKVRSMSAEKCNSKCESFYSSSKTQLMLHGCNMSLPCLVPQVFSECGLTIQSRMGVAEFKEIVLSGSYAMRTELDSPDKKGYKRMGLFPK